MRKHLAIAVAAAALSVGIALPLVTFAVSNAKRPATKYLDLTATHSNGPLSSVASVGLKD